MKDIRTRLLLSAACFFLCLSIAAPVRAGKDAIRPRPPLPVNAEKVRELNNVAKLMSRSDRLLLLDNVVSFWKLRVSIGERNPKDTSRPETFGLVENGQLSPSFVARTALQLLVMASNEGIMNFPEACDNEEDKRKLLRLFNGVPEQYRLYVPFAKLESVAQEWLGWPFDKAALPKTDYILLGEKGLFLDYDAMFQSWPLRHQQRAFALPINLYQHGGDNWIMEGTVRVPEQAEGDICRINRRESFGIHLKRTDGCWRILFLGFCDTWRPLLFGNDGMPDDRGRLHVLGFDMQ